MAIYRKFDELVDKHLNYGDIIVIGGNRYLVSSYRIGGIVTLTDKKYKVLGLNDIHLPVAINRYNDDEYTENNMIAAKRLALALLAFQEGSPYIDLLYPSGYMRFYKKDYLALPSFNVKSRKITIGKDRIYLDSRITQYLTFKQIETIIKKWGSDYTINREGMWTVRFEDWFDSHCRLAIGCQSYEKQEVISLYEKIKKLAKSGKGKTSKR